MEAVRLMKTTSRRRRRRPAFRTTWRAGHTCIGVFFLLSFEIVLCIYGLAFVV